MDNLSFVLMDFVINREVRLQRIAVKQILEGDTKARTDETEEEIKEAWIDNITTDMEIRGHFLEA